MIDPAPAVARQVGRLLDARGLRRSSGERLVQSSAIRYLTTGEPASIESLLPRFVDQEGQVKKLRWRENYLEEM